MIKKKTIKLNNALYPGDTDQVEFTLEEYAKRWTDHAKQLHKLCWCDSREAFEANRKTIEQVEKLVNQMIEVAFNDTYEKQQKKKVTV